MSSNVPVYTGPWVNWANGPVMGATLTLTTRDGAFMVAFLALFVRLAGSHLWRIFCFVVHQWKSTRQSRDAFHHQQQAVLRNASSVTGALWLWLRVAWAWRSNTSKPARRSVALLAAAIVHIAAFAVAGIFSSHVTVTSSATLIQSSHCGYWPFDVHNLTISQQFAFDDNLEREIQRSLSYTRSCYNNSDITSSSNCETYITQTIPQTVNSTASCPFAEALCLTPAVEIESEYIDSNLDLGINARKEDRILYRRKALCSVLRTEGYTNSSVSSVPAPSLQASSAYPFSNNTYFYYGPYGKNNFTYSFSNYSVSDEAPWLFNNGYSLDVISSSLNPPWSPIPELYEQDGDVDLLFLSNLATYIEPVNDPWFSASTKQTATNGKLNTTIFSANNNPSPLGCITHHQFCNPSIESGCTDWAGIKQIPQYIQRLSLNQMQSATFDRLYQAAWNSSFIGVVQGCEPTILIAEQLYEVITQYLPNNQWILEVANFHNVMMAHMQQLMVSYATGPSNPGYYQYLINATTKEEQYICDNQIVIRKDYASFSIFGIAMILAFGGLFILINLLLEPVVRFLRKRTSIGEGAYRQLEWDLTSTLQLQRLMYEGQGTGRWEGEVDDIPVTAERVGIPQWTEFTAGHDKEGSSSEMVDSPLMKAN